MLPSPACGRGAGGEGRHLRNATASTSWKLPPSPRPSPASGRGSTQSAAQLPARAIWARNLGEHRPTVDPATRAGPTLAAETAPLTP
ncbi:hypothetical protein CBM2586_A50134 [Cupriavidus phytorum]|uniref:Uncharacterized protein n=1 Tax=Cupriavidus taiwanensis TaxID=164546 RepID=A0A375C2Z2_9BURK|nr:hypothetical protein CBM2586_A50134 [Cupriavidus taiwanensis]